MESKEVTFIEEIIHQVDNRGLKLEDLLPKWMANNGVVNYQVFFNMISSFFH